MTDQAHEGLIAGRNRLALAGAAGLVVCAAFWLFWPAETLRGYLVAHQFWLGIALGSLVLWMIHHLAGGRWSGSLRRTLEAAALTLPLSALLFIPLLFTLGDLYVWARPEVVSGDHNLLHKEPYLNLWFFVGRMVLYYLVWIGLAWRLRMWSRRQEAEADPEIAARMARLSGPGLVLYGLTITFASTDWVMSLQPRWFSTIFCMICATLHMISGLAFAVVVLVLLRDRPPLARVLAPERFRMLGSMLLALVMLWAYVAFSQWIITWTANLPEEIVWYLPRLEGGWQWIGMALIGLQFGLPFFALLSMNVKRHPRRLAAVAWFLLAMCAVNWFWEVVPSFAPPELLGHWRAMLAAAAAMAGIGGVWLAAFLHYLAEAPLVPHNDPRLGEIG